MRERTCSVFAPRLHQGEQEQYANVLRFPFRCPFAHFIFSSLLVNEALIPPNQTVVNAARTSKNEEVIGLSRCSGTIAAIARNDSGKPWEPEMRWANQQSNPLSPPEYESIVHTASSTGTRQLNGGADEKHIATPHRPPNQRLVTNWPAGSPAKDRKKTVCWHLRQLDVRFRSRTVRPSWCWFAKYETLRFLQPQAKDKADRFFVFCACTEHSPKPNCVLAFTTTGCPFPFKNCEAFVVLVRQTDSSSSAHVPNIHLNQTVCWHLRQLDVRFRSRTVRPSWCWFAKYETLRFLQPQAKDKADRFFVFCACTEHSPKPNCVLAFTTTGCPFPFKNCAAFVVLVRQSSCHSLSFSRREDWHRCKVARCVNGTSEVGAYSRSLSLSLSRVVPRCRAADKRHFQVVALRLATLRCVMSQFSFPACVADRFRRISHGRDEIQPIRALTLQTVVDSVARATNTGCDARNQRRGIRSISSLKTIFFPLPLLVKLFFFWGRGGLVVRILASHLGEPGSITGGVAPGFSHVGIVPYDAVGRRVFSGISRFPHPCIPTLLHTHLTLISSQGPLC
ncbi:hypothetical protein PR048_029184 [Dryococelus australis]|uniref:Uncharacterized protein n=1 Tax=Dryococelus australis TaxID=614101 RepID=A0ABQ9GCR0_9NEOP|nr:hypothetical protein PR048_029184 [Dryococelus australis]